MIWIRADGNSEIGIGHVMRCLTVAEELQALGREVCFVLADKNMVGILQDRGLDCLVLHTDYTCMESELDILSDLVRKHCPELMLIDSYYVTEEYFRQVSRLVKTAYMDDMGICSDFVELLINYNIYASREMYKVKEGSEVRFLLGSAYAPLRKEFRNNENVKPKTVKNVFISTGGSDKYNLAGTILECVLKDEKLKEFTYHVICGKMNIHAEALKKLEEQCSNVCIHQNVTNMAEIMQKCELAISAAGSTMYELAALSIPIITFSFAENQKTAVKTFESKNAAVSVGDYTDSDKKDFQMRITDAIKDLCKDGKKRSEMAANAHRMVDGRGAIRIAQALTECCDAV